MVVILHHALNTTRTRPMPKRSKRPKVVVRTFGASGENIDLGSPQPSQQAIASINRVSRGPAGRIGQETTHLVAISSAPQVQPMQPLFNLKDDLDRSCTPDSFIQGEDESQPVDFGDDQVDASSNPVCVSS
jgi:hypothetical protein